MGILGEQEAVLRGPGEVSKGQGPAPQQRYAGTVPSTGQGVLEGQDVETWG